MADCGTNTLEVGPSAASGVNSTCISSPHIVQYPRVPKRDDGMWMSIGTMVGALIGKFANEDKLADASAAEAAWRDLNDKLKLQGTKEWERVDPQRALALDADTILHSISDKNIRYEYDEKAYADKLKACDDALHDRLCALAQCGYMPDYTGIMLRARADAASVTATKRKALLRDTRRYNTCQTAAMCADLNNAEISAVVSAVAIAREAERQATWKYKWDTTVQATQIFEADRLNRAKLASDYDRQAIAIEQNRYTGHTAEAEMSLKQGADMLASAGQNYAWLAESLRRSAEKDAGNISALLGLLFPMIYSLANFNKDPCEKAATA